MLVKYQSNRGITVGETNRKLGGDTILCKLHHLFNLFQPVRSRRLPVIVSNTIAGALYNFAISK